MPSVFNADKAHPSIGPTSNDSLICKIHKHHLVLVEHDTVWLPYTMSKNVSEYDKTIPQSHTADQPTAACGRANEDPQSQDIRKTIKVKPLTQMNIQSVQ